MWWFEVPWIWRFPLDYYLGIALSIVLAALAAWAAGDGRAAPPPPLDARRARRPDRADRARSRRSTTAGTATCAAPAPTTAASRTPIRRPRPAEAWAGGVPDLHPLDSSRRRRRRGHVKKWPLAAGGALAGAAGWARLQRADAEGPGLRHDVRRHARRGQAHGADLRRRPQHRVDAAAARGAREARRQGDVLHDRRVRARSSPRSCARSPPRATRSATTPTRTSRCRSTPTRRSAASCARRPTRSRPRASRWRVAHGQAADATALRPPPARHAARAAGGGLRRGSPGR